jgi:hypothetical protein
MFDVVAPVIGLWWMDKVMRFWVSAAVAFKTYDLEKLSYEDADISCSWSFYPIF